MLSSAPRIALASFRNNRAGFLKLQSGINYTRAYSVKGRFKEINRRINKFGEEDTKESQATLKILRKIGGVSVIIVICLILLASTFVDNPDFEPIQVLDLSKDVRDPR